MKIKLDDKAFMPIKAHEADAGFDLYAPEDFIVPACSFILENTIRYNLPVPYLNVGSAFIDTGVHIELPDGTVGMIKSKSGLNVKHGLTTEGVIDAGYTGSIGIKLYNHTDVDYEFKRGDKIAQLVIMPIIKPELEQVDELEETDRGNGGFGSTER